MEGNLNVFGISIHPFSPHQTPPSTETHRAVSMPGISSEKGSCWFCWMRACCCFLDFTFGVRRRVLGSREAVTSLYDKWVSKKARSSGEAELLTVSVSSTPGPLKARAQINLDECDRFGQRKFAEINKRTRAA